VSRLVEETKKIVIGNPNAAEHRERTGMIGPVVSAGQYKKVTGLIEQGVKAGAKLLAGGRRPAGAQFAKGYYIQPTILDLASTDVRHGVRYSASHFLARLTRCLRCLRVSATEPALA
jgi:acyl-CoA reductase-like NAD-dependent aldehyde dehydrogenase